MKRKKKASSCDTSSSGTKKAKSAQAEHAVWEVYLSDRAAWMPFDPHTITLLEQGHQHGETQLQVYSAFTIVCPFPCLL